MLHDLYHHSNATLYCLVRTSGQTPKKTLQNALLKYGLFFDMSTRIIPIEGDLSQPQLGISSENFEFLSRQIDIIYHVAAYVHHIYPYEALRAANVLSTVDLLKLATQHKNKTVHYVSTLSAVDKTPERPYIHEHFIDTFTIPKGMEDGYSQTKWVTECLLAQAAERGIAVRIYRPGWILGHSKTGLITPDSNHLLLLIKSCVEMGCAPNWDAQLNILPVDSVSQYILRISKRKDIGECVFNLVNQYTVSWHTLITTLCDYGYAIEWVAPELWQSQLKKLNQDSALFSLLSVYLNPESDWIKGLESICHAENTHTQMALQRIGLTYPEIDLPLLHQYIQFLVERGFLKPLNETQTMGVDA